MGFLFVARSACFVRLRDYASHGRLTTGNHKHNSVWHAAHTAAMQPMQYMQPAAQMAPMAGAPVCSSAKATVASSKSDSSRHGHTRPEQRLPFAWRSVQHQLLHHEQQVLPPSLSRKMASSKKAVYKRNESTVLRSVSRSVQVRVSADSTSTASTAEAACAGARRGVTRVKSCRTRRLQIQCNKMQHSHG
jgi:hypothetical protein